MSELQEEQPDRIRAENVDATAPELADTIQELGFKNHGLVIRSTGGEVLWKQPDHEVKMDEARAWLHHRLGAG